MSELVLAVMASTRGTDLQTVIDAIEAKELDARIACVLSNKEEAFALERARKHGIETIFLDPKGFDSSEAFDSKVVEIFKEKGVELILLIGYNKILTSTFLESFENKVMNIHPSLLPAFKGWYKTIYKQVLEANVKQTGCTLFFVDKDPDAGPIILQKTVPVLEEDTVDSLKEKVQVVEQQAILEGVKLFQEGKLVVEGKKVVVKH